MARSKNISALVVEGGGMRGVFSAGVLDAFGEAGFDPFDLYVGVSAGACNLASHLAGQYGRNYHIYSTYSITPEFISLKKYLRGGHFMDLDWLWESTIRDYRLDLKKIFGKLKKQKKEYVLGVTSLDTGGVVYLNPDADNLEHLLKISSAIPLLYRNTLSTGNENALDGGIAAPIPVFEAYRRGAKTITVIRSRPADYIKQKSRMDFLMPLIFRKHPALAAALKKRPAIYMDSVAFIKNPPDDVTVHEIASPSGMPVDRVTKNLKILNDSYNTGMECGKNYIKNFRM
jgi:predicted patatin/cPLA2 family phospholipase